MTTSTIGWLRDQSTTLVGIVDRVETRTWLGVLGIVGFGLVAVLGPTVAPYPPGTSVAQPLQPPSASHLLGTDDLGRDVLSQLLVGARTSLLVGLLAGSLSILLGLVIGLTAGVVGGLVETVLMRALDVMLTIPFLPLVIVAAAVLGPSMWTTVFLLAAVMWAQPARELRAQVLSIREREYVKASRTMGASSAHIGFRYVLPAVVPIAVAQFAKSASTAILLESSLSFLGLGDPTSPSWGTMLFYAQNRSAFLTDAWTWWVIPPGVAITVSVLSFTFLSLGVERHTAKTRQRTPRKTGSHAVELLQRNDPSDPVLEIDDLRVEYDDDSMAVEDLTLSLERAETLGIVGESGSGKSSLLLAVLGLLRYPGLVTNGYIRLRLDDVDDDTEVRNVRGDDIGFVPQEAMNALDPRQTLRRQVVDAMCRHQSISRSEARELAATHLERVGIDAEAHTNYPHELSGGMCQRGVIAMALANDPAILVVDEPTTGLDTVTKRDVLRLLDELQAEFGYAMLLVTHDLSVVTDVSDRIAVMQEGRVVAVDNTETMRTTPDHPYAAKLLGTRPTLPTAEESEPSSGRQLALEEESDLEVPALHYDGVAKTFEDEPVLKKVDLAVQRGESVALIGESGAGKSTIGRMAVGLMEPDNGTVSIDGERVIGRQTQDGRLLGKDVHYLFQDPYSSIPPNQQVHEIVSEPLVIHELGDDRQRRNRVGVLLDEVGLTPVGEYVGRYPTELSGGERQRVALARALAVEPDVLVADEPTSMLDAPLQQELLTVLYDLVADREISLLHVTHDIVQACAFADRVAVLHDGRVVEEGTPTSILHQPTHEQTRTLVEATIDLTSTSRTKAAHSNSND